MTHGGTEAPRMYVHDELTQRIIGCAIQVHRALGPGLLESTYEGALGIELAEAGLTFDRQQPIPVTYRGRIVGEYRPDLVVAKRVIVEIKSVDRLIGGAQLLAYMRVLKMPVGLLINFNSEVLRTAIKRYVI
jgi:GxxExxY protein